MHVYFVTSGLHYAMSTNRCFEKTAIQYLNGNSVSCK